MQTAYGAGSKVCSNGPGHMTKMTVIYGKKKPFKILFSRTSRPMASERGM